ncbi:MAG: ATP-binding protein [Defluviitaleaceae bacterium]|nr:ATP-binding protein [Defluviitaleaceae bacterium]
MRKILCNPLVKVFYFLAGYGFAVSALRARSHTFDVLLGRFFGGVFRFGFAVSVVCLGVCAAVLLLSVWMTKPEGKREAVFQYWRNVDFILLVLVAACGVWYLMNSAYAEWRYIFSYIPPFLAYTVVMFILIEFAARIRDGDLLRTLYWVRFFRVYPVWRLTGLSFTLILMGGLALFIVLFPPIGTRLNYWLNLMIYGVSGGINAPPMRRFYDLSNLLRVFSAVTVVGLTGFAAHLLNLAQKYEAANADKLRSEQFKTELITNVSHDIRTPLTSIINYVDLLKSEELRNETAAGYVAVLERKSRRLKILIDDLMEASKAGTGNLRVETESVNLNEIVGQIAGEFDTAFSERDLTLVLRQPEEPLRVTADSRHLWRVLENLFSNAAKYALPGTRVFAEITAQNGDAVIILKNTSQIPIDAPRDDLAEQFIRGDRARQTEGSGLGLYIAKSLVELMGGRLTIRVTGDLFDAEISIPVI